MVLPVKSSYFKAIVLSVQIRQIRVIRGLFVCVFRFRFPLEPCSMLQPQVGLTFHQARTCSRETLRGSANDTSPRQTPAKTHDTPRSKSLRAPCVAQYHASPLDPLARAPCETRDPSAQDHPPGQSR